MAAEIVFGNSDNKENIEFASPFELFFSLLSFNVLHHVIYFKYDVNMIFHELLFQETDVRRNNCNRNVMKLNDAENDNNKETK